MNGHSKADNQLHTILYNINSSQLEHETASDQADQKQHFLSKILEPVRLVNPTVTFEETLERILNAAILIAQADIGFISLRNIKNRLDFKMGRNKLGQKLTLEEFHVMRDLINQSIKSEKILRQTRTDMSTRTSYPHILIAPLFLHTDLVGMLYLQSKNDMISTQSIKWRAFERFIEHASLAIRNSQYYKLIQDSEREKEKLHNSLIQSDNLAMRGTMAAKIGHEINNYLSGINANIEMALDLMRNKSKKSFVYERLEKAQEMVMNMSTLSSGLMSKGDFKTNIEKSSLNHVINKFFDFVQPIYERSNVQLEKKLDDNLPDVQIDSGLMIQVLFNIVKNAVEVAPNGRVQVQSYYDRKKRHVNIDISDDGPGIPEDKKDQIFDPSFSEKAGGHGYGLAICKEIIEKHHGVITVNSEKARGTCFTISLPLNAREDYAEVEFEQLEQLVHKVVSNYPQTVVPKSVKSNRAPSEKIVYAAVAN